MTINIKNINEFDLYNPPKDFISNCYQYYNLLREKNPIHRNPKSESHIRKGTRRVKRPEDLTWLGQLGENEVMPTVFQNHGLQ